MILINSTIQRKQQLFSLLSMISSNTLCLSFKKLRNYYQGYCLRLRRSSDDEEKDFGFNFVTNEIDTLAIDTWLNSDTAFVVKWYDQGLYENHAIQLIKENQPIFDNVNKKIIFSAINENYLKVLNSDSINVGIGDFSYVSKVNFTSFTASHVFFKGQFTAPRSYVRMYYFADALKFAIEDIAAPEENALYNSIETSKDYTLIGIKEGDTIKSYKDAVLQNTTPITQSYGSLDSTSDLFIGSQRDNRECLDGIIESLFLFKKALTENEIKLINKYI